MLKTNWSQLLKFKYGHFQEILAKIISFFLFSEHFWVSIQPNNSIYLFFYLTKAYFGVGVSQLDSNIALLFVLEANSEHTGERLYHSGFTVSYVANGSHVNSGLATHYFERERSQLGGILILFEQIKKKKIQFR